MIWNRYQYWVTELKVKLQIIVKKEENYRMIENKTAKKNYNKC